ncbi:rhomboid family intramembrane serine protease [Chitinophaga cymbidii]|uniref:Rhomboid family intramembrane serine protease n=1 Tax=Chitinophaga cymbidii TaxID=1096750 RepID=A0A512RHR8_9BACT|nr:rhomboid family intramembrane serine protease [Chitinophaga cymbidii]GEP95238.1 rhomboid family intramembrane serine protease [Chitinophaga cymbidii]
MSEFRPGRFQMLPLVIKNLLIINGLVYLAQITLEKMNGYDLSALLGLHYWGSELFMPHQFVTHLFLHDPSTFFHLLSNMFALWMFGSTLENVWGPKRFLIFYMICGIGAAFCHMLVLTYDNIQLSNYVAAYFANPSFDTFAAFQQKFEIQSLQSFYEAWSVRPAESPEMIKLGQYYLGEYLEVYRNMPTVGASGAVFGVLFAFGYLFPNAMLFIIPIPFPIKAKYFVGFYILMELFLGFRNSAGDNVAHFAHLGGVLFAYILLKIWNKRNRRTFY